MEELSNVHIIFSIQPEGSRPLGRPGHRWEDYIKMGHKELEGWCGLDSSGFSMTPFHGVN
jgi:hypothetical protein